MTFCCCNSWDVSLVALGVESGVASGVEPGASRVESDVTSDFESESAPSPESFDPLPYLFIDFES